MNPDPSAVLNHIFVDFENVQKIDPAVIGGKTARITLLMGPLNKKLDMNVVEELLKHPSALQFVRLASSGRNALDFALAYYLGRAAVGDPQGRFHIVSKDKGFDPLVEHLQSKGLQIMRHDSFATLSLSRPATAKVSPPSPARAKSKPKAKVRTAKSRLNELAIRALEHLRKATTKPPKNLQKLVSHLGTHLGKKITASEVPGLVESLRSDGFLAIDEKGVVTYDLK